MPSMFIISPTGAVPPAVRKKEWCIALLQVHTWLVACAHPFWCDPSAMHPAPPLPPLHPSVRAATTAAWPTSPPPSGAARWTPASTCHPATPTRSSASAAASGTGCRCGAPRQGWEGWRREGGWLLDPPPPCRWRRRWKSLCCRPLAQIPSSAPSLNCSWQGGACVQAAWQRQTHGPSASGGQERAAGGPAAALLWAGSSRITTEWGSRKECLPARGFRRADISVVHVPGAYRACVVTAVQLTEPPPCPALPCPAACSASKRRLRASAVLGRLSALTCMSHTWRTGGWVAGWAVLGAVFIARYPGWWSLSIHTLLHACTSSPLPAPTRSTVRTAAALHTRVCCPALRCSDNRDSLIAFLRWAFQQPGETWVLTHQQVGRGAGHGEDSAGAVKRQEGWVHQRASGQPGETRVVTWLLIC